jgi:selenocysteine-specific translation elongation factor
LEGRIIGVFGTDNGAKTGLLGAVAKRSEAEGIIVYRKVESGISLSFLDDPNFPERVQGYARIASIADHALYILPKYGKIAAPDGELAVIIDSFRLDGAILSVDEEPPSGIGSYFKGTRLESFAAQSRSSSSSVIDSALVGTGSNAPPKGALVYVDRAFSVKGVGVVVLGFVLAGSVSVHDELRLVPHADGKTAEVRGIQVSDEDQESVGRGLRVGLSLKGVELKDLDKVAWLDDGSLQLSNSLSFSFAQSRFYKQSLDGRGDLHLQLPGESFLCKLKMEGSGRASASLPTTTTMTGVPVWEGMKVALLDLNGKGLRVAGGGVVGSGAQG